MDRRGYDRPGRSFVLPCQGIHFQNEHEFGPYCRQAPQGCFPIYRALTLTREERMIRELILQMKLGQVQEAYFSNKFGVEIQERFRRPIE